MGVDLGSKLELALEEEAIKTEVSRSDLVRHALQFYLGTDPLVRANAKRFAMGLDMTEADILQRVFIGWMARRDARREVWGPTQSILEEFMDTTPDRMSKQALYDFLKQKYVQEETQEKFRAVSKGGDNEPENLQLLCGRCNQRKGARG